MSSVRLGWASAEVKDAKLTVALEGEPPEGWKDSFETTLRLLGDGEWGKVKLKKGAVQVSDVPPGTEEKLRHHLESIVAQANATQEAGERDAENDEHAEEEQRSGPDAEMTERFRSFDDHDEEEDADAEH